MKISEFTVPRRLISYDIRGLDIGPFSSGIGAYKIDFSGFKLTGIHLIPQSDKVLINDIFYHFLNVTLSCSACYGIADTIVFKIIFVIGFKYPLAVNVKSAHLMQDICLAKK